MYEPRRKVFWFSLLSRLAIIILQLIFNLIIPDHKSDGFISPINHQEQSSNYDKLILIIFGGLTRWDGEYFIHIAKYGYTFENTLAFFPLYPISVRLISRLLKKILFGLNDHSLIIISGILINYICFVKSSVVFYDLTKKVLGDKMIAYKASILYCINPASIFFTAIYSESMFAYLTFSSMLAAIKNNRFVCLPIGLSAIVRSNGLINIGYPLYLWFKELFFFTIPKLIFEYKHPNEYNQSIISEILNIIANILWIFNTILLSLVPFILLQTYNYILFCTDRTNSTTLPIFIVHYADINHLILPGNDEKSSWCYYNLPLSYSYVQKKYWNVGFLNYYSIKQIPNFTLAIPILYIMLKYILEYFNENKKQLINLTFLKINKQQKLSRYKLYPIQLFPFIIHGLFLTTFCILFVHIQVSTRLLGSASPLMYWYCAKLMSHKIKYNEQNYEINDNVISKWKVFIFNQNKYTKKDQLILIYFLGYTILGTFMYSNNLPWT